MTLLTQSTKYLFLFFISLCVVVHFLTLKNGHNWGEDFSQYIMHARNIVEGKPYASQIMLDNPVIYPPGYPILLAPIIAVVGINFGVLKILNILFWFGTIFICFLILKDDVDELTRWLFSVFLSCSSFFFIFKQNIISDIPFLFFVTLALYLANKIFQTSIQQGNAWRESLFLFFLIGFCLWLRSAGLAIALSICFYSLFIKRRTDVFFISLSSVIVFYFLQRLWIGSNSGYFYSIFMYPKEFIFSIINHSYLLFQSLWYFVFPPLSIVSQSIHSVIETYMRYASLFLFLIILVYLFNRFIRREIDLIEVFCFFYGGLVIFWSGFPNKPADFVRFVFPLILPVFILIVRISKKVFIYLKKTWRGNFLKVSLGILVFINLINIAAVFDFNDDVLYQEENLTMFTWLKNNLGQDEHYMMWPPRVGALMTGRIGTSFWLDANHPHADWQKRIDKFDIHYLVFHKWGDQQLISSVVNDTKHFVAVWENTVFRIYKYNKE